MKLHYFTIGLLLSAGSSMGQSVLRNAPAITPDSRVQQVQHMRQETINPATENPQQLNSYNSTSVTGRDVSPALQPLRADVTSAPDRKANNKTLFVQDNALRDPKYFNYNVPGRPTSRNAYVNPGTGMVLARYNHSFRRYFYYCALAGNMPDKNRMADAAANAINVNRIKDRLRTDNKRQPLCNCSHTNYKGMLITGIVPLCSVHLVKDLQLLPDNTARHSNSATYFSFDGYVVYENDTIAGVVTIAANEVSLEYRNIKNNRRSISYDLRDSKLQAITLYKGPRELNLVRLNSTDKHLNRVVHCGRLSVYDRSYSFLTTSNISRKLTLIKEDGTRQIKSTSELAEAIAETYNRTDVQKMNREKLLTTLNRLN